jgi:ketosteroid isomerase-like protein
LYLPLHAVANERRVPYTCVSIEETAPMPHTEHPNVAAVRSMFAAFRAADVEAVMKAVPEDLVWHFPGTRGRIAGSHRGRDAVLEFLALVMSLTNGTFGLDLIDVVGGEHWVVALFRGHGERNGKTLDNPTCLRVRFEGDRPVEIHEFVWDLVAVDDFWS